MNTIIELPNEVYERLAKQAQARGITIAETIEQALGEIEANRQQAVIEQLRAEGKILPKQPLPPGYQRIYKRVEVQEKPISESLIEERR